MVVEAPWYVPNMVIQMDLHPPTVKEEIHHYSSHYSAHQNDLVVNLMTQSDNRQLRRHLQNNLPTRSRCNGHVFSHSL
jgi:hypothetical protein